MSNQKKLKVSTLLILFSLMLAGCEFRKTLPSCGGFLKEKIQTRFLIKEDSPVAFDRLTNIKWYRCSAGEVLVENQCVGDALKLNWLEAQSYAREFSESSGENWKVAQYWQLRELQRDDCISPALDTRVFPNLEISHYWSRDEHIFSDRIACSMYTYKGQGYCWQRKKSELPFLLVSDENAKQITLLGRINRMLIDFFN